MTVARLRLELSNDEFLHWSIYFGRKSQKEQLAQKRR